MYLPTLNKVLYCIVLDWIGLDWIGLYCIVLYCIVLYCIVLYCIVLYCIVNPWTVLSPPNELGTVSDYLKNEETKKVVYV